MRARADCLGRCDAAMYRTILGAAWFVITAAPYLPLPDHRMDYYLAVPVDRHRDGGRVCDREMGEVRRPVRAVAIGLAILAVYGGVQLQASWTVTRWQHARGAQVEDLVLGVEEVHQAAKGKIILLDGIDSDLFWSGVVDLPFRAMAIPSRVPCTGQRSAHSGGPGPAFEIRAAAGDRAAARWRPNAAVVYRFDGEMLHDVTAQAGGRWTEETPRFVNIWGCGLRRLSGHRAGGRPRMRCRRMNGVGTLHIGAPRDSHESLYLGSL